MRDCATRWHFGSDRLLRHNAPATYRPAPHRRSSGIVLWALRHEHARPVPATSHHPGSRPRARVVQPRAPHRELVALAYLVRRYGHCRRHAAYANVWFASGGITLGRDSTASYRQKTAKIDNMPRLFSDVGNKLRIVVTSGLDRAASGSRRAQRSEYP